jgi:hypothetical protein
MSAHQLEPPDELFIRLEHIDCALHLGDKFERLVGDAELCRLQILRRDQLAQRDHEEIEEIEDHGFLCVHARRRPIGKTVAQFQRRILPGACLAQVRRRDSDVLERGL